MCIGQIFQHIYFHLLESSKDKKYDGWNYYRKKMLQWLAWYCNWGQGHIDGIFLLDNWNKQACHFPNVVYSWPFFNEKLKCAPWT